MAQNTPPTSENVEDSSSSPDVHPSSLGNDDNQNDDKSVPLPVKGFVVAAIVFAIVFAAGFVDKDPWSVHAPVNVWWWLGLAFPLLLWGAWMMGLPFSGRGNSGSFGATLLGQSPIMIGLAATVTVGIYVLPEEQYRWFEGRGDDAALLAGVGVALAFGLGVAFFRGDFTAPNNINPDVYGALSSEFHDLNAQLEAYCPEIPPEDSSQVAEGAACMLPHHAACAKAREHRNFIATELGLPRSLNPSGSSTCNPPACKPSTGARWVLGTGYIDIWHRLHAVDEALFLVKPDAAVAGDGLYDVMRLKDSNISNRVDHVGRLRTAVTVFGASTYLSTPPQAPPLQRVITDEEKARARVVLQQVRHVINEYRDDRREGLVRTRNDMLLTGTLTGVISLLLLGLVVLRRVEESTLVAAMVFYLVGAIVGLFNQLSSGWGNAGATEEDYGLNQTRLVFTPLLSGLAAIGGVLVTTMLYASLSGPIVTTQDVTGATPSSVTLEVPQLSDIFDLNEGRFGLIIAAVFGLTPSLLVDRLKGQADKYKADLQSSSAQGNE